MKAYLNHVPMKVLTLILLFAFSGSNFDVETTSIESKDKEVILSVELSNGETIEKVGTLSELEEMFNALPEDLDSDTYTVMFSNGDCKTTASTQAAAWAGFSACACELGHDRFCNEE